jgi:hypothetical protein
VDFAAACDRLHTPPASEWPCGFIGHDETFCRLAAHLWWRSTRIGGCILRPWYLRFGSDYTGLEFLPSPAEMIDALYPEFAEFHQLGLPLRRLEKLSPPAAYTRLWD